MKQGYKRIVSFARKRSNNPTYEARIIQDLLPKYSVVVPEDCTMVGSLADICRKEHSKYVLEIGFGSGENILDRAIENRDTAFIGCEVFTGGVVKLLEQVEENKLENIYIWHEDALELIIRLPDNSLDLIYILHPDPWPKQRHKKRRLINPELLELLAKKTKENGEILIITDHADYAKHITKSVSQVQNLFTQKHDNYPKITRTKYRIKAEEEGSKLEYFYLIKKIL